MRSWRCNERCSTSNPSTGDQPLSARKISCVRFTIVIESWRYGIWNSNQQINKQTNKSQGWTNTKESERRIISETAWKRTSQVKKTNKQTNNYRWFAADGSSVTSISHQRGKLGTGTDPGTRDAGTGSTNATAGGNGWIYRNRASQRSRASRGRAE